MLFIQLDRTSRHQPYYLQIVEQVRNTILSNKLLPGSCLPPTRQLARELGISRRTVVVAYEELCAQGYCTSRIGQGTIVADIPVLEKEKDINPIHSFPQWFSPQPPTVPSTEDNSSETIYFTPGIPQVDYLSTKAMRKAFQQVVNDFNDKLAYYQKNNGVPTLLEAICESILPNRGIQATPSQVLVTNGSQHSSFLLSLLFASYGGSISYGIPGYLAIPKNFTSKGITGKPCPIDSEGIQLTEEALSARFHYLMPEHHFPTTATLSPQRRAWLLQLAQEQDALIIEDDYDSEFFYDRHPLPALKAEDKGGRVIYMGTFSKVLFNSLRLGYIVAHPQIIQQLVELRWQLDGGTSSVLQLWVAELIQSGTLERHLRRMRVHYRNKRDLIASYLRQCFPQWHWQLPSGGLQFWVELPPDEPAETVIDQLWEKGVGFYRGANYYEAFSEEANHRLILGFGAVTKPQIQQAFDKLGRGVA